MTEDASHRAQQTRGHENESSLRGSDAASGLRQASAPLAAVSRATT